MSLLILFQSSAVTPVDIPYADVVSMTATLNKTISANVRLNKTISNNATLNKTISMTYTEMESTE